MDRVERDEYVLQNTLHSKLDSVKNGTQIRINRKKRYYVVDYIEFRSCYDLNENDYIFHGPNNEFLHLTNINDGSMNPGEWYLCPSAFSITLTPP